LGNAFPTLALAVLLTAFLSACGASDIKEKRAEAAASNVVVETAFDANCEKLLVREINRAEKEIVVAIYNITRKGINAALVHAAKRGVKVRLKYDENSHHESKGMAGAIKYLQNNGIDCTPVKMSKESGLMHDKFTVIDGKRVLTGSFNYTSAASTLNYENIVLIESEDVAKNFLAEFDKIKSK